MSQFPMFFRHKKTGQIFHALSNSDVSELLKECEPLKKVTPKAEEKPKKEAEEKPRKKRKYTRRVKEDSSTNILVDKKPVKRKTIKEE